MEQPSSATPQEGGRDSKCPDSTLLSPNNLCSCLPLAEPNQKREEKGICERTQYLSTSQDTEHDREWGRVSLEGQMEDFQPR